MKLMLPIVLLSAGLAMLVFLQPGGCRRKPTSGLPTVRMQLGTETFTLEVANTPATREYGLMHRDSMPADHGMLFVFPEERGQGFWMKNTRIPLDIIFLNAAGRVVSVHQMKPHDLQSTRSDGPAMYAIEINKGRAAEAGVKAGDQLQIPSGVESR